MTLWKLFAALLAAAAMCLGVAVAFGVASLPSDWSRVGLWIMIATGWLIWEVLIRDRGQANGRSLREPSRLAKRLSIGVTVLIALFVVIAIAAGWLSV